MIDTEVIDAPRIDNVDILIIGGGLIGSAVAWHCAAAGARTMLVDKGWMNAGASGQNAGSLHFQIERRFLEQGGALTDEAARTTTLNRIAIDDWATIEQKLDADLHVRRDGGLMVAHTREEVALLEAKVRCERAAGLATVMLDGDGARDIAPYLSGGVAAAAYLPDEGHADPLLATEAFARAAQRAGATLLYRREVAALTGVSAGFEAKVRADGQVGTINAGRVLIATGAWSPRVAALANVHLPLFPVGLGMNISEATTPFVPHLVQHVGRRLSMKQNANGNVLIGGGWPARLRRDAGGFDPGGRPQMIEESLLGNLRAAVDVIPAVAQLNLLRSWTGVTAVSADQLPLAGNIPSQPRLFVAAGGSAFTLGPSLARLVARLMLDSDDGEAAELLAVASPARFDHLNGFMR